LATVEADSSDGKQDGKQDTLVERDSVSEKSGSGPNYNPCLSLLFSIAAGAVTISAISRR
jgi:hypothetical protein